MAVVFDHVACCCPRRGYSAVVVADRDRSIVGYGTATMVDTQAVSSDTRRRCHCMEKGHGLREFLRTNGLPRCRVVSRVAQVERGVEERRSERREETTEKRAQVSGSSIAN